MDYPVSSQFISENGTVIQNGFRGAFHIDLNGKIGFFDQTGSSLRKFGYILAAGKEGAMSTNYEMKLLTSAGTVEYLRRPPALWWMERLERAMKCTGSCKIIPKW